MMALRNAIKSASGYIPIAAIVAVAFAMAAASAWAQSVGSIENTVAANPAVFWAVVITLLGVIMAMIKREVGKFETAIARLDAKMSAMFARVDEHAERLARIEAEHALLTCQPRPPLRRTMMGLHEETEG